MRVPPLDQLVADARRSIKFPGAAWDLWEAATDPKLDAAAVQRVLERDPGLSAQVLKLANSAAYGRTGEVGDLKRAIALLGRREIADLALIAAGTSGFSGLENRLLRHIDFWTHSISCARLARELAGAVQLSRDEAFAAGLLHDVGHLVLFGLCGEAMAAVLEEALDEDCGLQVVEARRLGFDHAALGAAVLRDWQMPRKLCDTVGLHHRELRSIPDPLASVIALANRGASFVEADEDPSLDVGMALAAHLGCEAGEVGARLAAIQERAQSICSGLDA
jgi:putative nucleotidyltransferase with HDIG domain